MFEHYRRKAENHAALAGQMIIGNNSDPVVLLAVRARTDVARAFTAIAELYRPNA